jgi:hypothetical protein
MNTPLLKLGLSLFLLISCLSTTAPAQNVENSLLLPNKGTIYVLLVFAEEVGSCANPNCNDFPPGPSVPANANDWLDHTQTFPPVGKITNYYHQASFGSYKVQGDYLPTVLQVNLSGSCPMSAPTTSIINQVNALITQGNTTTARGLPLTVGPNSLFDQWTLNTPATGPGLAKLNAHDGKLDALVIVWRNHRGWCGASGYGVQGGLTNLFNSVGSFAGGWQFFVAEYFHALFGHNNWHTGGGAGAHTFLAFPNAFGTTSQSGTTSSVANAWDRGQMGWLPAGRTSAFTATDANCAADVPADLDIAASPLPSGATFCLRDYNLTGDALRLKLPHLDWATTTFPTPPAVKNQYLIIENHRLHTSQTPYNFNVDTYAGDGTDCTEQGQPGLYAYLQVGKDVKTGPNIYTGNYDHPNGLGSWFYPLEPEGRWDYVYRFDKFQGASWTIPCNWNNANIPREPTNSQTLPNPFTGYSDLFGYIDSNNDGTLYAGDGIQSWLSKVKPGGVTWNNWFWHGDARDSYRPGFRTRIALDTNPAPVPVYTYTFYNPGFSVNPQPYENRRIYLNGIEVKITGQTPQGNMLVSVSWDKYAVNDDVRWTGNVVLRNDPDDPLARKSEIDLAPGNTIDLDQGLSPTQYKKVGLLADGTALFAKPSAITLEAGTRATVQDSAQLVVRNGSTLHVKTGAELKLLGTGGVTIGAGSHLCVEPGATVNLLNTDSRIRLNVGANVGVNPALGISPAPACQPAASIATAGAGQVVANNGCHDPAGTLLKSATKAFFPFDEQSQVGVAQELAFHNNAAKVNNPAPCPGIVGGALCFDGLASHTFTVPNSNALDLGTGDFSVEGWIRTYAAGNILDKRVYPVGSNQSAYQGYLLFIDSAGRLALQLADGLGSSGGWANYISKEVVTDGKWHHVVVTVDRNNPQGGIFYVDCRQAQVGNGTTFNPTGRQGSLSNSSALYFGRQSFTTTFSGPGFWSGAVDEFSIYNRVLSAAEIQALCHSSDLGKCNVAAFLNRDVSPLYMKHQATFVDSACTYCQ